MIEAALALAQRGVAVFPVSPDKRPRTPNGFKNATTDEATIRSWNWVDALIGSPPPVGTVVVDVDPRNGGDKTLAEFPALPRTRTTRTRSGGSHYWLSVDPELKMRGVLGPGVDIKRAEKGYVIIPPSPGYEYVVFGEAAPAPAWLIDELVVVEREIGGTAGPPKFFPFEPGTMYGQAALRNTLTRLAGAENGARNDELNKAAFGLAQLVAGGELSKTVALDGLLRVAAEIDLAEWEAMNTIESGWTAGERIPRQAPGREKEYD